MMAGYDTSIHKKCRTNCSHQKANYQLFNCNNLKYAIGARNTAAAGTILFLKFILDKGLNSSLSNCQT